MGGVGRVAGSVTVVSGEGLHSGVCERVFSKWAYWKGMPGSDKKNKVACKMDFSYRERDPRDLSQVYKQRGL